MPENIEVQCDSCQQVNLFKKNIVQQLYCNFCFKKLSEAPVTRTDQYESLSSVNLIEEKFTFPELLIFFALMLFLCFLMLVFSELARFYSEYASFIGYASSFSFLSFILYGFSTERKYASYLFSGKDLRSYLVICLAGLFSILFMFSLLCRQIHLLDNTLFIAPSFSKPLDWFLFGFSTFFETIFLDIPSIYGLQLSNIRPNAASTKNWLMIYKLIIEFVLIKALIKYANIKTSFIDKIFPQDERDTRPRMQIKRILLFIFLIFAMIGLTLFFGWLCQKVHLFFPGFFSTNDYRTSNWIFFAWQNLLEVILFDAPQVYGLKMSSVNSISFTANTMMLLFRVTINLFLINVLLRLWDLLHLNEKIVEMIFEGPIEKKIGLFINFAFFFLIFVIALFYSLFSF